MTAHCRTLPLWTQVVGKIGVARMPLRAHWWNIALGVTARGLTTPLLPAEHASFQIAFDFVDHEREVLTTAGGRRTTPLEPRRGVDSRQSEPHQGFWGALDLAVSRFSGSAAPPYLGHVPHCGPQVMREAYSHELISAGYWPGPNGEGNFYAYAYPAPDGYQDRPVRPAEPHFDHALGEFVLPYEVVRRSPDPDRTLLEFLESTSTVAADLAGCNRAPLER